MKPVLTALRRLIFGETWTIPLGVAAALVLAVVVRAALPGPAWATAGGFLLAVTIAATLAFSVRRGSKGS
jgi:hypothetical protein